MEARRGSAGILRSKPAALAVGVGLLLVALACGAEKLPAVRSLERGDPQRKAILDELRLPVKTALRLDAVVFKVSRIAVLGGWAFVHGVPLNPDGSAIDYTRTMYGRQLEEGMFDDNISALLRMEGERWFVVHYDIGATDVSYWTWPDDYGAPAELLGLPGE